ncbi:hypothetical protein Tco_0582715, partial [Tanacetum coccineum]
KSVDEKPADPKPKRGRGKLPKITRSPDPAADPGQCSNSVERAHSHIKEVVRIKNLLKKNVEDFPSLMSSSLDAYGKLVKGCSETYNIQKESFVKVQNAYEDFNGHSLCSGSGKIQHRMQVAELNLILEKQSPYAIMSNHIRASATEE